MKTKVTLLSLLAFLFFMTDAIAQCTNGTKYPFNNYSPLNSGAFETINTDCDPGEYALITNTLTTKVYTFASSVATDYITITNINDEVLAHGPSGLSWIRPTTSGSNIKYFIHSNPNCSEEGASRTRFIASQPLPSCGTPTALNVSNMTSNSCRISWTAPATAPGSGYEVYVNTAMITPLASVTVTGSTTTNAIESLSGLNPATSYYYWVRSNCGSQKGVWIYGGGFTTNAFTACNGATYGLYPTTTFTPACTGNAEQIAANSWAGQYTNINAVTDKQYTFSSSVATDYITITNADGTTVYATGTTPLTWSSSAVSGVIRYYLHANSACGIQNSNRIKSITCATAACEVPSNLAVSNITSNSCKVTWTAPSVLPSAGYELYRNTTGTAPVAATVATTTAASNIINPMTGLIGDTTYFYWIRSVCGTTKSGWVSGGSFTTNPLSACNGAFRGLYPEATFTPACTGASEVIATDSKGGEYTNVNIVANKQYTFSSSVGADYITITNEDGSIVYATGDSPLSWPSNTINGVIRYYLHSTSGCAAADTNRTRSITCAPVSSCSWPIGITASSITSTSALISWIPNGPSLGDPEIFVSSLSYAAPMSGNTTTGGTRPNGVIVNQLLANTVYYLYARKFCSGGVITPWISAGTFKTLPEIYQSCNGAFYGVFPMETFTPQHTGSLEVITTSSAASQFSYINLSADKQYIFKSSINTDYITITNEAGTAVLGKGSSPFTWNSGAFSGIARYYIHTQVACASSNSTRGKYVTGTSNCVAPSVPTVSNINASSARFFWTGNASSFQYYYATSSTTPGTDYPTTDNILTAKNITVNNLLPGTTYYYWIRSVCGDLTSAWIAGGNFTTLAGGCISGTLYPNNTFTPFCTGGPETVTTEAYAGEYSIVNITPSTSYSFESSVATDYLTITNVDATILYAHGTTPLNWSSNTTTGPIRFYIHTDINCGIQSVDRTRTITCISPNTCGLPTNIAVSNITSNSVQYAYTAPANAPTIGYQFQATLTNVAPLASAPALANTSNTYGNMSGLLPNTTYYSWVRSLCFSGAGLWVAGPSFTTISTATTGCNGASNGLWPLETFTPACSGTAEVITTSAFTGQYSNINITDNKLYTFTSSVATDYITITNENGTVTYAAGTSPLLWYSNTTSGIARYHLNSNSACAVVATERTKSLSCETPVCDPITTFYAYNITSNSMTLDWSSSPSSGNYQYYVSTQNVAPTGAVTVYGINANRIQLQNLNSATVYYYWVRVNCGLGIFSDWSTGSFTTGNALSCNGTTVPAGYSGLYPSTTFTPACTGDAEVITNSTWAGEYSNVAIIPNKQYTFISSTATDYLTITTADGNTILNSGTTPVTWLSGNTTGTVRFFLHTNASCGSSSVARTRSIICAEPCIAPVAPMFTPVGPICAGGYLSPLPIDSINGVNGSWSPALNNMATTTYTFTPDLGECAVPATMTIVVTTPNIVPTFAQVGPICPGTYISPLNVDSTNGIHGSWSPALNNMATTTYTFTPMPGQCAVPTTMTIATTLPPSIVPTFYQRPPICIGGFQDPLPEDSENGINGSWSPALNNMATTTYTFTPAPGQCAVSTTMTIVVSNQNIVPTFVQVPPICQGSYLSPLWEDSTNGIYGTWSPALNNMATTTYTFTPAPGQCAVPTTMTITVATSPYIVPTFAQVPAICQGSYLGALPVDSTNGIHGSWSPAVNNMATTTYTFTPYQGQCAVPTTMTINVATSPYIIPTFAQVSPICQGSYLATLPVDSTNGIHGSWSPALNNMATTTYTFTPMPGQCAVTTTMTIYVSTSPFIVPTFYQRSPICLGGFQDPLPDESENGINGSWSPALNNMATTTYTFTPAPGQCAVSTTMTITVTNGNTVPTFTPVAPICMGGYLSPLPLYSNQQIHGSWSPALNNMATTTYTFTPTAGQCAVPATMTITVSNQGVIVPTFAQVQPLCQGVFPGTLPVDSTNGINGSWSPALNSNATTTYTFTPAPGQCATTTTMTIAIIEVPAAPTAVFACGAYTLPALPNGYVYSGTTNEGIPLAVGTPIFSSQAVPFYYENVSCGTQGSFNVTIQQMDNSIVLNGGTLAALMAGTGVTYQWYKCYPNEQLIQGATSQGFTPTQSGNYQVKITIPGCDSIFSDCMLVDTLGIENNPFAGTLKMYPNPTRGQFIVETGTVVIERITVIDNLGRIIKTVQPSSFKTEMDIAEFAEGVYLIKIENQGTATIKKLVLRK